MEGGELMRRSVAAKAKSTAQLTALGRATAFLDDEPLLRAPDHLAIRFLDPGLAFLARSPLFRRLLRRVYQRRFPGGYLYAIARTKHIDQVLPRELEAGTDHRYDSGRRTLFIWEGVTMYLPLAAVDETLAFVARQSGPGSSIVFDYIFRAVLDGDTTLLGAAETIRSVRKRGEPFLFGIDAGGVHTFLKDRGLEALGGDRRGQHSIRINDQYRICFVWKDGEAQHVEVVDYH
jgi:O-methyltransferase involved in polyketide biosynthesis